MTQSQALCIIGRQQTLSSTSMQTHTHAHKPSTQKVCMSVCNLCSHSLHGTATHAEGRRACPSSNMKRRVQQRPLPRVREVACRRVNGTFRHITTTTTTTTSTRQPRLTPPRRLKEGAERQRRRGSILKVQPTGNKPKADKSRGPLLAHAQPYAHPCTNLPTLTRTLSPQPQHQQHQASSSRSRRLQPATHRAAALTHRAVSGVWGSSLNTS